MFTTGRILLVLAVGAIVYAGFMAVPQGKHTVGDFDADAVAADEAAVWQAIHAHEEFGAFVSEVSLQREENQYTWFRAVEAGFYLARAMTTVNGLHSGYERVLPDLEAAATIERDWTHASFNPDDVAKAQLDWWITERTPTLGSVQNVAALMAKEYALRYHLPADRVLPAATLRSEAAGLLDEGGADPDWTAITNRLGDSYRALHGAIQQARTKQSLTY